LAEEQENLITKTGKYYNNTKGGETSRGGDHSKTMHGPQIRSETFTKRSHDSN